MSDIEDIERAIERLSVDELERFRAWYDAFDAKRFDERIASDAAAGRLDRLADQALSAKRAGQVREL